MEDDIELKCTICGNNEFDLIKTLLTSKMSAILDVEFADKYVYGYVCRKCTHIEWFKEDILKE